MRKNSLALMSMFAMSGALSGGMFSADIGIFDSEKFKEKPEEKPSWKNPTMPSKRPSVVIPKGMKPFVINIAGSDYTIHVLNAKNAKKKEISLNLIAYGVLGEHMFEYVKPTPKFSDNIAGCRKAYEDAKKLTIQKIKNFSESYTLGESSEKDLMFEGLSNGGGITSFALDFLKHF